MSNKNTRELGNIAEIMAKSAVKSASLWGNLQSQILQHLTDIPLFDLARVIKGLAHSEANIPSTTWEPILKYLESLLSQELPTTVDEKNEDKMRQTLVNVSKILNFLDKAHLLGEDPGLLSVFDQLLSKHMDLIETSD